MRVALHVGQLRQKVPGGIGRYTEALCREIPEFGVDLLTFAAGSVPARDGVTLPGLTDLGLPHDGARYELWHRLRRPRLPFAADVVHAPSLAVPPRSDSALVVTVHDVAFLNHPELFTRRGVSFHKAGLAIAGKEADAIITASSFVGRQLINLGFDEKRIHVIPHGVTLAPTADRSDAERRLEALGISPPFILQVGTVEPRKGVDTLIAALQRARREIPTLTLVLAGPVGWGDVAGLNATGVRSLGLVDDSLLEALYSTASVTTVASRSEGFGLPALEALAHGSPLIASDATSLPEVVAGAGILVPPDHPAAWSKAILDILTDNTFSDELRARGPKRAAMFSWEASALAHFKAYQNAIDSHLDRQRGLLP